MDGVLLSSVENAFAAVIGNAIGSQANIYTGKDSMNKILPAVICLADGESIEEDPPRTGNFWVSVEIQVKATAATEAGAVIDPKTPDLALMANVFNAIKVDNLDALLNETGQSLTVFPNGYFFSSPKAGWDELGGWVDYLPIRLYCCPTVLAA